MQCSAKGGVGGMSRAAIAILSTQNLLHNLGVIKRRAPNKKVIAMVKANAYGHGLRSVSLRLQPMVDSLGVASIDEALALRKVGITRPITLMEGVFEPNELVVASCQNFHVVFHDQEQLRWLESSQLPNPLTAWMKIDTGMGRLGFAIDQVEPIYNLLSKSSNISQPLGIMSHFACADEESHAMNTRQIEAFQRLGQFPGPKSFSNSAAIFNLPSQHYDVIRPGLALYGVSPISQISAEQLDLRPVMTLQTRLITIRNMRMGDYIGYGSRFMCPCDMPVGVIAMGYGDGYSRTTRDGAPILVNGKCCQVVGRVSMDMTMIDLRACKDAKVGDPVTLWGEGLPVEKVAAYTQHSPYDILCGVQMRVKFNWTAP